MLRRLLAVLLVSGAVVSTAGAQSDPSVPADARPSEAATAPGKVEGPKPPDEAIMRLDQRVKILERRLELEQEAAAERAKQTPLVGAGKDGFFLKSGDGDFKLRLGGLLHADGRFLSGESSSAAADTFLLRRVRLIFEGTVFRNIDFRFMPDFGEGKVVLQDAYGELTYLPWAKVRAGKFKTPFGLERLQSASSLMFIERGLPTNLVPNRDLGVQWGGDLWDGRLTYAAGIFNGVPDGGSADVDVDGNFEFAGRLFAHPFRKSGRESLENLGLGAAVSYGTPEGQTANPYLPSFKTPGQDTFFKYRSTGAAAGTTIADGTHTRFSPQAYYYYGSFGALAEYVVSSQEVTRGKSHADLSNSAWQVAVSYVLTGEPASYKGVEPRKPLDPKTGGWGAWEAVARYGELTVDEDAFPVYADPAKSAQKARAWGVGLNWYINKNTKFSIDYDSTTFTGGAAGGDREGETAIMTRLQFAF